MTDTNNITYVDHTAFNNSAKCKCGAVEFSVKGAALLVRGIFFRLSLWPIPTILDIVLRFLIPLSDLTLVQLSFSSSMLPAIATGADFPRTISSQKGATTQKKKPEVCQSHSGSRTTSNLKRAPALPMEAEKEFRWLFSK